MPTNLFTDYSQGENRVTATFLAVLERLSLPNIGHILGALIGNDTFSLAAFQNQPQGKKSTPDAKISTGHAIWVETKVKRGTARREQIKKHLESVSAGEKLLLLTPDGDKPAWIDDLNKCIGDKEVVWSDFIALAGAVGEILDDKNEPPSEREAFLLREFVQMMDDKGLLVKDRVMVRAGGFGWPYYEKFSAYFYTPGLTFKASDHLAFYANNEIKKLVPRKGMIIGPIDVLNDDAVEVLGRLEQKEFAKKMQKGIGWHNSQNPRNPMNGSLMFMELSGPDDSKTLKLANAIKNDKKTGNDRGVAWMMGNTRYVTLESLKMATKTSQLKPC